MRHVIIGAGPAGIIAAETLRKLAPSDEVTVIGDEPEPPYSRMAIPYYLVEKVGEEGTHLRHAPDHFERLGIGIVQDRVTQVMPDQRQVTLEKGSAPLPYDRLLIASGSRPVRPPIPGMDLPGVQSCWTLADARHIHQRARPGARVVLMGAGFIGCIVLEALAAKGVQLTVVEMGDRMVPRMMNHTAGTLLKQWCERQGVTVLTSAKVEAIESVTGKQQPLLVRLEGGKELPADLVISATGVRPNIELLKDSGVAIDDGVLVDQHLRTNVPDIYCAGDVCQGRDFSTGQYSVQAIQPTAAEHGRISARNMAGIETPHAGCINMNVLDTLGLISSSFGLWMGSDGGEAAELCDSGNFRYLQLQFEGDRLIGAQSLGLTQNVGVLRGMIQARTRLKAWKERLMKDPTRLMEAYLASTQAIGHNAYVLR